VSHHPYFYILIICHRSQLTSCRCNATHMRMNKLKPSTLCPACSPTKVPRHPPHLSHLCQASREHLQALALTGPSDVTPVRLPSAVDLAARVRHNMQHKARLAAAGELYKHKHGSSQHATVCRDTGVSGEEATGMHCLPNISNTTCAHVSAPVQAHVRVQRTANCPPPTAPACRLECKICQRYHSH
jgi:hypothetical protein